MISLSGSTHGKISKGNPGCFEKTQPLAEVSSWGHESVGVGHVEWWNRPEAPARGLLPAQGGRRQGSGFSLLHFLCVLQWMVGICGGSFKGSANME